MSIKIADVYRESLKKVIKLITAATVFDFGRNPNLACIEKFSSCIKAFQSLIINRSINLKKLDSTEIRR
jgi:hypothetical protein